MRWCTRCVLPDTRPNLVLDGDGVCNACRSHGSKPQIDWAGRRAKLREVAEHAKVRSQDWDCLVPVSGGKDSTWQVVECLELGLKPLAVTWKTPGRTPIGQRNLDNLVRLGVDHVDFQVSPKTEKAFVWQSLQRFGTSAIPMHMALFNVPLRLAVSFRIPLVVWGENSAFEYGGTAEESRGFQLDDRWLRKYGVTHGTTAEDWISPELSRKDLAPYFGPTDVELAGAGVLAIFLGYYLGWDPERSVQVARAHGFESRSEGPRTGLYDYADIDDDFISIHHWFKWYKFGFTRLFDNLSLEIRNGRLTRDAAVEIIRAKGDDTPRGDIAKLCAWMGVSEDRFFDVAEGFRNPDVWKRGADGVWRIPEFLVADWRWA